MVIDNPPYLKIIVIIIIIIFSNHNNEKLPNSIKYFNKIIIIYIIYQYLRIIRVITLIIINNHNNEKLPNSIKCFNKINYSYFATCSKIYVLSWYLFTENPVKKKEKNRSKITHHCLIPHVRLFSFSNPIKYQSEVKSEELRKIIRKDTYPHD